VVELTLALSVILLPEAALTFTTIVIVILPAFVSELAVQVKVPVPPTGGAVQVPSVVITLTNVVPAGVVSVTEMAWAVSGPLFLTLI
jgi:hypothetical protein